MVVVDGSNKAPLHEDRDAAQAGGNGRDDHVNQRADGADRHDDEQAAIDDGSSHQADTDHLFKADLLADNGAQEEHHNAQHHREGALHAHDADVAEDIAIHIAAESLGHILLGADADAVDNQGDEGAVLGEKFANIAEFHAAVLADSLHRGQIALFGPEVVQQAEDKADHRADRRAGAEGEGSIAVLGEQLGQDHEGQHVADQRAEAAGARQGGTFAVVVCHSAKQRPHRDVKHGVAAFVQNFAEEQHNQHCGALEEGGHGPESNRRDAEQRRDAQQPGAELALGVVGFGVHFVHQDAHQRVVDGVPNVPDKQQNRQNRSVDLQDVGVVAGDHRAHQREGHTTAQVAHRITDPMLQGQATFFGGRCHRIDFLLLYSCGGLGPLPPIWFNCNAFHHAKGIAIIRKTIADPANFCYNVSNFTKRRRCFL